MAQRLTVSSDMSKVARSRRSRALCGLKFRSDPLSKLGRSPALCRCNPGLFGETFERLDELLVSLVQLVLDHLGLVGGRADPGHAISEVVRDRSRGRLKCGVAEKIKVVTLKWGQHLLLLFVRGVSLYAPSCRLPAR